MGKRSNDVEVWNDGSMVLLTPKTERASHWIRDNVHTESWNWLGMSLAVELRFADAIIQGMTGDGVVVGVA